MRRRLVELVRVQGAEREDRRRRQPADAVAERLARAVAPADERRAERLARAVGRAREQLASDADAVAVVNAPRRAPCLFDRLPAVRRVAPRATHRAAGENESKK